MENHDHHHQENTTTNQHEQETEPLCSDWAPNNNGNATNFTQQASPDDADIIPQEIFLCPWQRMKWTEEMVKVLITTLSYADEDGSDLSTPCTDDHPNNHQRRNYLLLRKMGKWKCVSKVMSEIGYHVSPQQCEDKYNNLNKGYRRLNELLGRGTSCNVVANPKLLDTMDIAEDDKEEVRKILTSKHLFFEEMCSFHNQNRVCLPHDSNVLQCVLCVLNNIENYVPCGLIRQRIEEDDDEGNGNDNWKEIIGIELDPNFHELRNEDGFFDEEELAKRLRKIEEQKLMLEAKMLELESKRIKWQQRCRKEEMKLEMMRFENENFKLENKRIAMELERKIAAKQHKPLNI